MIKKIKILILSFALLIISCDLPDNSTQYVDKLVVFGKIDMLQISENEYDSIIEVTVSMSSAIDNNIEHTDELYINDAIVKITGNLNLNENDTTFTTITLIHNNNDKLGTYYPPNDNYKIWPNSTYTLEVETSDGFYKINSETTTPNALSVESIDQFLGEQIMWICEECSDPFIYDQTSCENEGETWNITEEAIGTVNVNNFFDIVSENSIQEIRNNPDILQEYIDNDQISTIYLSRYGCSVGSFASKPYFILEFNEQDDSEQSVIRTLSEALEHEKMDMEPWTDLNQDGIADKGEFFDYNYNEIHDETRINTFYDTTTVFKLWKGPYWRDENYNPYLDNPFIWNVETSPYPIMWLFFNYYGKHIMYIQSTDAAYYEYLSGDPLGQNIYLLPDSNINDGYGLFYSTFSTPFFLNVERAD